MGLKDALMSIFLDEKARKTVKKTAKARKMTKRERDIANLQQNVGHVMTPERQEIIANAMKVRAAKAKIFDDLKDEDKQKLYALAVKTLLREGRDEPGGK